MSHLLMEVSLEKARAAILENLAIRSRRLPERSRREAGDTVERPHDIREVAKGTLRAMPLPRPFARAPPVDWTVTGSLLARRCWTWPPALHSRDSSVTSGQPLSLTSSAARRARAQVEENAAEYFAIVGTRAPIVSFKAGE
jgi:hypothetical protein